MPRPAISPIHLAQRVRFANGGRLLAPVHPRHAVRTIDTHELILVERGVLRMFCGTDRFSVRPGGFLHLPVGVEHGGMDDYPEDIRFTWLHFHHRGPLRGLVPSGTLARPAIAEDLAARLLDEQDRVDAPPGSRDLLMALLLLECAAAKPGLAGDDPNGLADRARRHIALHHREPISTREVAAACGCHGDHLGRLFRKRFGQTIVDALNAERVHTAKGLLRDSNYRVDAIARACGFQDAHYFRRIFHRSTGVSPRAWRGAHRRMRINAR